MASLSLPRVLQQRKTSLEIERENFEKCQATAISKAINNLETPVKQKHVRSTIIGTFQEKGAQTFWIVVLRLPLQEDRIVAWKFCHVLHKVLREGYPTAIQHSQRHRGELENLGKLWVHLRDCYGKLIKLYSTLLITKLDFHRKNPRFPGNLSVTHSELENIGENDINIYFQMSVEMFDYMDNILDLQAAIFGSIDRSRSNSMTSSGQCRLSPLIPCIQDASRLYDFCVKILFKLHLSLPPDTLSGHRERFLKQFKELKQFYQNSNALQYFRNLITIPSLPENPPNFLIQAELRTYVTPVVIIPPEEPETDSVSEANLIDTSSESPSDTVDSTNHNGSTSPSQHFTEILAERDNLIDHLHRENKGLRLESQRMNKEYQKTITNLQEQVTAVETELATRESELVQERQLKEDLFHQAAATAQTQDSEQKLKEEKFTKLKDVYTKLREEHIQLIRQKADVEKKLLAASKTVGELERTKAEVQSKLNEIAQEHSREQELLQQSTSDQILELEILRREHDTLTSNNELLNSKVERLTDDKSTLERNLDDMRQQKEQLDTQVAELISSISILNATIEKLNDKTQENSREQERLQQSASQQNVELENIRKEKETLSADNDSLQSTIAILTDDKTSLERKMEEIQQEKQKMESRISELDLTAVSLNNSIDQLKVDKENKIREVMLACICESETIMKKTIDEVENPALSAVTCSPDYFNSLTEPSVSALNAAATVTHAQPAHLSVVATRLAHDLSVYIIQGRATSNTSPDIMFGEQMAEKCKQLGSSVLAVLQGLRENREVTEDVNRANLELKAMSELAETLRGSLKENSADVLADLVENELLAMDKNIEEAAKRIQEMLNTSREADTGIKLEVNEKILNVCTKLMLCIKLLIKHSRLLQGEIVAQGKGSASVKEFYKRNHRWTEGLLSAAKSVGTAAGFLLNAADKAICGDGKLEQLIVAAQEVAASTAQLVAASRVKADRNSQNLRDVTQASKNVSTATGEVIATVQDCIKKIDEVEEFDASKLTVHTTKRLEMDTQIRILELEKELDQNRTKFLALRRHHYQLAGENEGWDPTSDVQQ